MLTLLKRLENRPRGHPRPQLDRRAVGQNFGDARSELGRVVSHGDDRVRTFFLGVLHHPLEGIFAGGLANNGIRLDVAADNLF